MMKSTLALGLTVLALAACSEPAETPAEDAVATPVGPEATTAADSQPSEPYDGPIPMPIKVGGEGADMDACATHARVAGLEAGGETYLSVRDAPSDMVKERDRLEDARDVAICATDGEWSGVVYPEEGQAIGSCEVSSPIAEERNYVGPCLQGWVRSQYLEEIAG